MQRVIPSEMMGEQYVFMLFLMWKFCFIRLKNLMRLIQHLIMHPRAAEEMCEKLLQIRYLVVFI